MENVEDLLSFIRDVPDFPKEGIIFKDITPVLMNPDAFKFAIDSMAKPFENEEIDLVVGIEARGFITAASLAYKLGAGLVLVRKPGKLPWEKESATYELEYGTDTLEIHKDAINPDMNVVIADDLIATGGTGKACIELIEKVGGKVHALSFLIELAFLNPRENLANYTIHSVITY